MQLNIQQGYPDYIGRRLAFCGSGVGPTSYSQSTGDVLQPFAFQTYYDSVFIGESVSGTYYARARPSNAGPRQTWAIHWYVVATNAEVANAVNLSAETLVVSGFAGRY